MKRYVVFVGGYYIEKWAPQPYRKDEMLEIKACEDLKEAEIFTKLKTAKGCANWCRGKVLKINLEEVTHG